MAINNCIIFEFGRVDDECCVNNECSEYLKNTFKMPKVFKMCT